MIFFRIIILSLLLILGTAKIIFADNHDIAAEENIQSEVDEEQLPLNDPFAGNEGMSTQSFSTNEMEEKEDPMSLYNFKLVGIIEGQFESYVTLINATGELITIQMYEELSQGVRLVAINDKEEAVFEKNADSFLVINFKNQIRETSEEY